MKKVLLKGVNASKKMARNVSVAFTAIGVSAITATSAFAASGNADLDTATASLTDGVDSMKANALIIIAAVIAVIVVVFGIGWLIGIVKRNMSKA